MICILYCLWKYNDSFLEGIDDTYQGTTNDRGREDDSEESNQLPIYIGASAAGAVLLVVIIGLFLYRRKQNRGGRSKYFPIPLQARFDIKKNYLATSYLQLNLYAVDKQELWRSTR